MLSWLEGPYGPIIKFAVKLLVVLGLFIFVFTDGYHRGEAKVQAAWDLDHANQIIMAKRLADQHTAASQQIVNSLEVQLNEIRNSRDDVRAVVHNVCMRHDPSPAGGVALVPAAPQPVPAGTPTVGGGAIPYDPSNDINQCRDVQAKYLALRQWVLDNGGNQP